MGSRPCCENEGLNKGDWTAMEDEILTNYISIHGEGNWRNLSIDAGLKRCCNSCRLRWLNYLKPGIQKGNITSDEEDLIIRLHKLLGDRWTLIAGRLPGRTDNEIQNYWNTHIKKRFEDGHPTHHLHYEYQNNSGASSSSSCRHDDDLKLQTSSYVIRPKVTRCTKVVISEELQNIQQNINADNTENKAYNVNMCYDRQNGGQPNTNSDD